MSPYSLDLPQVDLFFILRAKGEGDPRATKSRAQETDRPGKYHWIGLLESLLMPVNSVPPTSFAIFTLKRTAVVFKQSVEMLSVGKSPNFKFAYRDNASDKLVLPQPHIDNDLKRSFPYTVELTSGTTYL